MKCPGSQTPAPANRTAVCPVCGRTLNPVGLANDRGWGRSRFPRHNTPEPSGYAKDACDECATRRDAYAVLGKGDGSPCPTHNPSSAPGGTP